MDYYDRRSAAFRDIDDMINERKSEEEMAVVISERYGFTSRIVKERIRQRILLKRKKVKA